MSILDSLVLIEYRKGTKTDLLESIVANRDLEPVINQVVVSEYLYYQHLNDTFCIFFKKICVKNLNNLC
jgi:predicted nucleic acid-binding protein